MMNLKRRQGQNVASAPSAKYQRQPDHSRDSRNAQRNRRKSDSPSCFLIRLLPRRDRTKRQDSRTETSKTPTAARQISRDFPARIRRRPPNHPNIRAAAFAVHHHDPDRQQRNCPDEHDVTQRLPGRLAFVDSRSQPIIGIDIPTRNKNPGKTMSTNVIQSALPGAWCIHHEPTPSGKSFS